MNLALELEEIEKQVSALISENINLKTENTNLKRENKELEADNDARKFAMSMSEKVEKQLREENADLKAELKSERYLHTIAYKQGTENQKKKDTEQLTSLLTSVENLNKSVQELEKKNVELKADNSEWEKASDKWKNLYYSTNEQLTEAEEIIKDLMRTSRDCIRWYLLCDKANKFIREIKDNDKRRDEK